MKFIVNPGTRIESFHLVDMNSVKQTVINKRRRGTNAIYYGGTKDMSKRASKKYDEAYYGDSVGNSILTGVIAIAETVILPVDIIESLFDRGAVDTRQDKKGAQKILANINSDIESVVIKHKYFNQIKNYVESYPESKNEEDYNLLLSFKTNKFKNCTINTHSKSKYRTNIIIDGKYSSKENNRIYSYTDDRKSGLVDTLISLEKNGKCIRK